MTMHRAVAILTVIWTACGASAVLMVRFFETTFIMTAFIGVFGVTLLLIIFLYLYMFLLARGHARKMAAYAAAGSGKCPRGSNNMRGVVTLSILFGAFLVCWVPFFFHLVIIMACPTNPYCECYRSLFQLHVVMLMSHALVDPAIYAFRSAELRHTLWRMLLCRACRR
ncbi:hypothetical protein CRUP_037130 [Coryphaenoides rupestris]|nr:hypothetical protein CRUP_025500 [Coryphaenoides rupestris]KAG7249175.1 hypothetical protein CRUP_037130 [Coryphaenoides rupestris]